MLNINNTLIAGGFFRGGKSWNKRASNLDKCFKLYQVKKGKAFLAGNDKQYALEGNGFYLINGFLIEKQYCPESFEVNWLHFNSDSIIVKQVLQKLPLVTKLEQYELNDMSSVFSLFESFFESYQGQRETMSREVLSGYMKIQSLLVWVVSMVSEKSESGIFSLSNNGTRLMKAVEFINTNYKVTVTLKELADLCFMSENYFHSQFKAEFNITPNTYILQLRMYDALSLLSNTDLSIKEVARETGYSDPAYFSRTFSKYFQLCPKKVRGLNSSRIP